MDNREREELMNDGPFESRSHRRTRLKKESYRARHSHPNDPDNPGDDREIHDCEEAGEC